MRLPPRPLPFIALAAGLAAAAAATPLAPDLEARSEPTSAVGRAAADCPGSCAPAAEVGSCQPGGTSLCMNRGRFQIAVTTRDFDDVVGEGKVVDFGSDNSGLFWFFDPDNWEMLVKVLDACGVNQHYWVFAAATTNIEYTLRVTDTLSGESREYVNPLGNAASALTDTTAFATCP